MGKQEADFREGTLSAFSQASTFAMHRGFGFGDRAAEAVHPDAVPSYH